MRSQALSNWFDPGAGQAQPQASLVRRIFWAALLVRVAYLALAHTYKVPRFDDHFEFGWEAARIARSLAAGHGYGSPFIVGNTGPTAWLPPLFPLLVAACFKLFGVYTPLAAWAVLAANCLFSAATAPAVFEIANRCFDRRVAVWSAWLWALYPAAMQYAVKWVWETTLTAMLFAWVLVIALRVRGIGSDGANPQTLRRWLLFGLLWGLIALSNPSLCLFLPVCGVWMLIGAKPFGPSFGKAIAAGALFLACVAPWTWRNWEVFHAFIPMRGNFGAEFYYGNRPEAEGFPWGHIVESQSEVRGYTELGEARYVARLGAAARLNLEANPARFAQLSLKRLYFFWAGVPRPLGAGAIAEYFREFHYALWSITGVLGLLLALERRIPAAGLFACAFLLLPATYYFVTVAARFRHPLEPLIAILTVYLFQSARRSRKGAV